MPSYNIFDKPCFMVRCGNEVKDVSLKEALMDAHKIDRFCNDLPIYDFASVRFLSAIVHSELDIVDTESIRSLMEAGKFSEDFIEKVAERFYDKLDLFSPDFPFMQSADVIDMAEKDVAKLVPTLPSGNNHTHSVKIMEGESRVHPMELINPLLYHSVYCFGDGRASDGKGFKTGINCVKGSPIYVYPVGKNIFETICYSLVSPEYRTGTLKKDGFPAWEKQSKENKNTYLSLLTWLPRKILLIPSDGGECTLSGRESDILVSEIRFERGMEPDSVTLLDPFIVYYLDSKEKKVKKVQIPPFQDSLTNYKSVLYKADGRMPPKVVEQLLELTDDNTVRLESFGFVKNGVASIASYTHEQMSFPVKVLNDEELLDMAILGLEFVSDVIVYARKRLLNFIRMHDCNIKSRKNGKDILEIENTIYTYISEMSAKMRDSFLGFMFGITEYDDDEVQKFKESVFSEAESIFFDIMDRQPKYLTEEHYYSNRQKTGFRNDIMKLIGGEQDDKK